MKYNLPVTPLRLTLISAAFVFAGCRDSPKERNQATPKEGISRNTNDSGRRKEMVGGAHSSIRNNGSQDGKVENSKTEGLDSAEKIRTLAENRGIESIRVIFDSLEGDKRAEAMSLALPVLTQKYDKTELLKFLEQLPAGQSKHQWIWQIVQKGQGTFDGNFFAAVTSFEFLEEKQTAINAFASFAKIKDIEEFGKAVEFLKSNPEIGNDYIDGMTSNLLSSFSATLIQNGPASAADSVVQLPENLRAAAVSTIAKALSAADDTSGLIFAGSLQVAPQLSQEAFSTCFDQMGRTRPSVAEKSLERVPLEFRPHAIAGFVRGWISQDANAASKWAGAQSGNDLKVASSEIVSYLERRRAPGAEIDPWRTLAKQQP